MKDIETALAWSALRSVLDDQSKSEMFSHVRSIKVTEKYITITTNKPIINEEFSFYRKMILRRYEENTKGFTHQKKIVRFI